MFVASPAAAAAPTYSVERTVIGAPSHGPRLCFGVEFSLPPQCGSGLDLIDWKWSRVKGEESTGGTTWGTYRIVGRYDGTRITVTDVGRATGKRNRDLDVDFRTPCTTPAGGWIRDPSNLGIPEFGVLTDIAEASPDYVTMWTDHSQGIEIKHFAFTGPPAAHRSELEALWGGPLCVVQFEHSREELFAAQAALDDPSLRLDVVASWIDAPGNRVGAQAIVADRAAQRRLDKRFGQGVVKVTSVLEPVR